jgi:hypothetical protein
MARAACESAPKTDSAPPAIEKSKTVACVMTAPPFLETLLSKDKTLLKRCG